jgi:hypothetical protein
LIRSSLAEPFISQTVKVRASGATEAAALGAALCAPVEAAGLAALLVQAAMLSTAASPMARVCLSFT